MENKNRPVSSSSASNRHPSRTASSTRAYWLTDARVPAAEHTNARMPETYTVMFWNMTNYHIGPCLQVKDCNFNKMLSYCRETALHGAL